jgi:cyclopropane fatty-acyl-phospholipid synthase-like methyltransferase
MTESRPASHFKRLYESNPDPWNFSTSPYEQAKYRHAVQTLGRRRFAAGLEIGCSIGILTRMLASRCDTLLGVDIVEHPLDAARWRCADQPRVRFERMQVPQEWPNGRFDLVVFSEVLYFLSPTDIDRCARRLTATLWPNATVLLVNWRGRSDDPCTGDEAASRFVRATKGALWLARQDRRDGYRLDLLRRTTPTIRQARPRSAGWMQNKDGLR